MDAVKCICCILSKATRLVVCGSMSTAGTPSAVVVCTPSMPLKLVTLLSAELLEECPVVSVSKVFRPVKFVHARPCFCVFLCFSVKPVFKLF
jgi:hypothetical protein